MLAVFSHTPLQRDHYRLGVPRAGFWKEVLNSDATWYGGSGLGNLGGVWARPVADHSHPQSIQITLPPLSCLVFKWFPA